MSASDPYLETRHAVLAKALPNVAFDGWSKAVLAAAIEAADIEPAMAELSFPQGVETLIKTDRKSVV